MPLVKRADVLVEQFRPGVMARLGLGYEALRKINPRLIYCSITGYGQTGPRAGEAGHDINYIGHTGLLALQPGPLDRPNVPPALIADIGGGTLPAVMNILLALRQRDRTGKGCDLDIAMSDAMFTFASHAIAVGHVDRHVSRRGRSAADRRLAALPALSDQGRQAGGLRRAGAEVLDGVHRGDRPCPRFIDDRRDPAATKSAVAAIIAGRTADEWRPVLAKADCCVTIVATLEEALRDPHFVGRGLFEHKVSGASGATMPALPVPIDPAFRARQKIRPLPTLGADNKLATAPRRASAAAAKRKARRPRAKRRGATGRSGR